MISKSPFENTSQVRVPHKPPTHLSKDEFQRLITSVKETQLKQVFMFAVLTGMRLGEILNLTWDKIDLNNRQIAVRNSEHFETKTGGSRTVPMNNLVYSMLVILKNEVFSSPYVFQRSGRPLQKFYVSHKFKSYCRSIKLSEELHFHSLRHTFATWLVQGGVNIYEVQKLLGHSSVKVTEVYSHLAASELHSSVNKIQLGKLT